MRRIRTRILAACLLAALLPAVPATLLVRGLLARSLSSGRHELLADGLEAGLDESRAALHARKLAFAAAARAALAATPPAGKLLVLDEAGAPLPGAAMPAGLADALAGLDAQPRQVGGFLALRGATTGDRMVTVAQALPAAVIDRAARLTAARRLAALLELDRGAILRSYALPFLVVYAALAALALGLAALLARGVVGPVESVSMAAGRVARGDLSVRVDERGPGEAADLARAFNAMVADLERQRRELARLEKLAAWRTMARMLAHEVKNPLTPILLSVQEARRSYRGDDEAHRAVLTDCETIVGEEVHRLRELVRSFSEFARLPAPQCADTDLGELARDLERLYGEHLAVTVPAGPLVACVDAGQVRRALLNLVDNGLAACRRAGTAERAELRIDRDGDHWRLAVSDRGDGIPPENLPRIFEPDFTTDGEGLGLGLPIVDGIVAGHGGTIDVDSAPGRGTTFTVRLPGAGATA